MLTVRGASGVQLLTFVAISLFSEVKAFQGGVGMISGGGLGRASATKSGAMRLRGLINFPGLGFSQQPSVQKSKEITKELLGERQASNFWSVRSFQRTSFSCNASLQQPSSYHVCLSHTCSLIQCAYDPGSWMAAVEECCPRCSPATGAHYSPIAVGHRGWFMYASSAPDRLLCRVNPFPLKPYTPSRKTVAKRISDDIVCFEQEHGFANVSAALAPLHTTTSRVLLLFEICVS